MKYDPMTGEPINEAAETVASAQVVAETTAGATAAGATTAGTATTKVVSAVSSLMTKAWFVPALAGGATAVVAVVAVAVMFVSGAFLSPIQKVTVAAGNTFKEAGIIGDVLTGSLVAAANDKNTTRILVDYSGVEMAMEYRHTKGDKQMWVMADVQNFPELEGTLTYTKKDIQLNAPILGDYNFVYNYTKLPEGEIFEEVDEKILEDLNQMLADAYAGKTYENSEALKEMKKELAELIEEIEVEEVDKEEFEINEKDVNCGGYEIVIDKKLVKDAIKIVRDGFVDYMEEMTGELSDYVDLEQLEDSFEDMLDSVSEMPEITLTVYLHNNMYAAIIVEVDGFDEELEILFEGGEYRAQNVTVKYAGDKVFRIKGETDGKEETVEYIVYSGSDSMTIAEYEYDKKSGDFEFVIEAGTEITIEGNLLANNNGIVITDGRIKAAGDKVDFEFSCKKGAKIEKVKGETFDIGEASVEDIQDIIEDVSDELGDLNIPGITGPSYDEDDYWNYY